MGIIIKNGGFQTTVQDFGRPGYQRYGMAMSGAVDRSAYKMANILVANNVYEAVLEAEMMGPTLEFTTETVIAITGADMSPKINNQPIDNYRAVRVQPGDKLSFGILKSGCRAYIAFNGGLDIKKVLGSRATYTKAHLGGLEGRKLKAGDTLEFRLPFTVPNNLEKRFIEPVVYGSDITVRVLLGPQEDRFTQKGIETFLNETYTVSPQFDRMGCRLDGPVIETVTDSNIISDGIAFGAIQVPDSGKPIIMLSDRQTTGGYAKIGSVINADIPMIAQAKAGDRIRFVLTDIETAQDAFCARRQANHEQRLKFDTLIPGNRIREFNVRIGDEEYRAMIEEL